MPDSDAIEEAVRSRYADVATSAASCCSAPDGFGRDGADVYGAARYEPADLDGLPAEAVAASIGCANPVAVADLRPGETVLDLGSGGGIDVLLSARRVGPTGMAYGVDMTDEMLDLARANQQQAGIANAEFLLGSIEAVPLPDAAVDVIVSNCVINLSADKPAVFAEAYRLLRPGGRLAVADVAADVAVDGAMRGNLEAWTDCIAGAVTRDDYRSMLETVGFSAVTSDDSHPVADGFTSVIVRAIKPEPPASLPPTR
jgi:ubiquinone/menaquinone biosynthesis C-methylase UbiE